MTSGSIFEIPYNFICEYLTGWTILILLAIIIYFIVLRKYYVKREQFYINLTENNTNKEDNTIFDIEDKLKNNYNNTSGNNKNNNSKKEKFYQDTVKLKGTRVFEGFQTDTTTTTTPTTTTPTKPTTTTIPITTTTTTTNTLADNPTLISTTLFDNLQLTPSQIQSVKLKYNDVISTYITKLSNLVKLRKQNDSLNVKKQYDIIIGDGIDNIIKYLNNVIKSANILTRTSIRADVVFTLQTTLEYLINKTNKELQQQMNKIAKMNSTTIDYNTMLKDINTSRDKLDEYYGIDDILSKYSSSQNSTTREINKTLDKSFILPIYEKNIDRINQLIKSDFNNDENNLAQKYSSAYNDFLEQQKQADLDINPLRLASQIESGILGMLSNVSGNSKSNNYEDNKNILEQYTAQYGYTQSNIQNNKNNPIPKNEMNLLNNVNLDKSNIFNDPSNLGNYLIDKKTQKNILEGFATETDNKKNTDKSNNKVDIVEKLMSGDFINYILEQANNKLNMFFGFYNKNVDNKLSGVGDNIKLDENMIPAGFLLFIISMLIYFIDITS